MQFLETLLNNENFLALLGSIITAVAAIALSVINKRTKSFDEKNQIETKIKLEELYNSVVISAIAHSEQIAKNYLKLHGIKLPPEDKLESAKKFVLKQLNAYGYSLDLDSVVDRIESMLNITDNTNEINFVDIPMESDDEEDV